MRTTTLLAAFALGALTALTVSGLAAAPAPAGKVTAAGQEESRSVGGGKARIDILARGQNAFVGRLTLRGGAAVPEHRDATEEYIHVLEGTGTLTMDGKAYEVGPGSTIYMPAKAQVSYVNGPKTMVAIQVFAGPEPAAKYDGWKPITNK